MQPLSFSNPCGNEKQTKSIDPLLIHSNCLMERKFDSLRSVVAGIVLKSKNTFPPLAVVKVDAGFSIRARMVNTVLFPDLYSFPCLLTPLETGKESTQKNRKLVCRLENRSLN